MKNSLVIMISLCSFAITANAATNTASTSSSVSGSYSYSASSNTSATTSNTRAQRFSVGAGGIVSSRQYPSSYSRYPNANGYRSRLNNNNYRSNYSSYYYPNSLNGSGGYYPRHYRHYNYPANYRYNTYRHH
jgi:hypothetical protein